MLSTIRTVVSTLVVLLMSLGWVGTTYAQATNTERLPVGGSLDVTMPLYKSRIVSVAELTGRVAVGNPDIADVVVISPTQMYVLAKDIGNTNLLFWSRDGRLLGTVNLEVVHDLDGLKSKLHQLLPGEAIEVHSAQRSIVLKGRASNVVVMDAAVRIAEGYLAQIQTAKDVQQFEQKGGTSRRDDKTVGNVINLIEVGGSQQVMLSVKVAEIERTELKRLNVNFMAYAFGSDGFGGAINGGGALTPGGVGAGPGGIVPPGGGVDIFESNPMRIIGQGLFGAFVDDNFRFSIALDAAKENGLAKILAEPTLTTLTGQEAEFLSGGEFPIPVPQGGVTGGVTIEFKPYGVGLKFLPVVLSDGRINLKVNVTVSELTSEAAVLLEDESFSSRFFIPSLRQRSASATVELGDGQSMGLAGLLDDKLRESVSKFPGLGSIPVLGALFRSNEYKKGQTELVILVTPHLAKPVAAGSVTLPTDGFVEPNDVDFYLWGRLEGGTKSSGGQKTN
jgi:pilus assembly protein CpaC